MKIKYFALVVFALHTLSEVAFGLNLFISGGSSSQSAEEIAAQSTQLTISARFLGSALLTLGFLGALTLFGLGVTSVAARYIAIALAAFHILVVWGVLISVGLDPAMLSETLTLGALLIHGTLGLGFIIVLLLLRPQT